MTRKLRPAIAGTLLAIAVFGLAGCANDNLSPTAPTPIQISAEAQAINSTGLAPADFFNVATKLSDTQCAAYFDALAQEGDKLRFASQQTNLLGGVAASLMGAVAAPGSGIAIAGAMAAATNQTIGNYAQMSAAGLYYDETGTLVQNAQTAYLRAAPQPTTVFEAAILAHRYAQLCSYAGIHALARQAIATAIPVASAESGGASLAAPRAPPRMIPPQISVRR